MKYTILPAQPDPKRLTAHYSARSLGEHFDAFMAANNIRGYMDELSVEEPIVEEVAAMWLIVVADIQYYRQLEALQLYRIQQQTERIARRQAKREEARKQREIEWNAKVDAAHARIESKPKTPLQEFEQARIKMARGKMYDVAQPDVSLSQAEYLSRKYRGRLTALLSDAETLIGEELLGSRLENSPLWRKHIVATRSDWTVRAVAVSDEIAKELKQYIGTVNPDEFLSHIPPKSGPTGQHRINPYLNK